MPDYEFYEGASTGAQIDAEVQKGLIVVSLGTVSALPVTKSNANILADHVCVNYVLSRASAMGGDWTVTTANGSVTVDGTLNNSTTITLYLGRAAQTVS